MIVNYYYIFGVRYNRNEEDLTSVLSLDFMIEYTDREIENTTMAKAMIDNEIFPTTKKDAIEACNLNRINTELVAASFIIKANNLTSHKVKSDIRLDREDLHMFVDMCNYSKDSLKKLKEAQIKL